MEEIKSRVVKMNECLEKQTAAQEKLRQALEAWCALREDYMALRDYYTGEEIHVDLAADEVGKLDGINRGVLCEDSIYNMLGDHYHLALDLVSYGADALRDY